MSSPLIFYKCRIWNTSMICPQSCHLLVKERNWASNGCPTFSCTPFTRPRPTAGKTAQSTHFSVVESVASCAFPKRGSTLESRGKWNCQEGKQIREQRMADLFCAVSGKKPHQNCSVDFRNFRKAKFEVSEFILLFQEGNWGYLLVLRTCFYVAWAPSFLGDQTFLWGTIPKYFLSRLVLLHLTIT